MPRLIVPSSGGGKKVMRTLRAVGEAPASATLDCPPQTEEVSSKKKKRVLCSA